MLKMVLCELCLKIKNKYSNIDDSSLGAYVAKYFPLYFEVIQNYLSKVYFIALSQLFYRQSQQQVRSAMTASLMLKHSIYFTFELRKVAEHLKRMNLMFAFLQIRLKMQPNLLHRYLR